VFRSKLDVLQAVLVRLIGGRVPVKAQRLSFRERRHQISKIEVAPAAKSDSGVHPPALGKSFPVVLA
jgi:hypothetical protein